MTALLREGLRELGLDESRAETLERFAALLLKKNEMMNHRHHGAGGRRAAASARQRGADTVR